MYYVFFEVRASMLHSFGELSQHDITAHKFGVAKKIGGTKTGGEYAGQSLKNKCEANSKLIASKSIEVSKENSNWF